MQCPECGYYLARLHHKPLCYSKSVEVLKHSVRLLLHYLKFGDVPVPACFILISSNANVVVNFQVIFAWVVPGVVIAHALPEKILELFG